MFPINHTLAEHPSNDMRALCSKHCPGLIYTGYIKGFTLQLPFGKKMRLKEWQFHIDHSVLLSYGHSCLAAIKAAPHWQVTNKKKDRVLLYLFEEARWTVSALWAHRIPSPTCFAPIPPKAIQTFPSTYLYFNLSLKATGSLTGYQHKLRLRTCKILLHFLIWNMEKNSIMVLQLSVNILSNNFSKHWTYRFINQSVFAHEFPKVNVG